MIHYLDSHIHITLLSCARHPPLLTPVFPEVALWELCYVHVCDKAVKNPSMNLIFRWQFTGSQCKNMTSGTDRPQVPIATSHQNSHTGAYSCFLKNKQTKKNRVKCGLWKHLQHYWLVGEVDGSRTDLV